MRISWLAIAAAASLAFCGSAHATQFVQNGDFTALTDVTPQPGNPAGPANPVGAGNLGQLGYNTNATGWNVPDPNNGGSYAFVFNQGATPSNGQYGSVSLWTGGNGGVSSWDGLSSIGSAHNFVGMDSSFQTGALTQSITGLTIGNQYTLSFDYAFGQQAGFTGDTIGQWTYSLGGDTSQTNIYSVKSQDFTGWQTKSTTFTASSTTELLSFLASGSPQVPPFALLSNISLTGTSAAPAPGLATGPLAVLGLLAFGYARRRLRGQA